MTAGPPCAWKILLHCHTKTKYTWKQQEVQLTGPSHVEHQQVLHVVDPLIALSRNKYSLSQ